MDGAHCNDFFPSGAKITELRLEIRIDARVLSPGSQLAGCIRTKAFRAKTAIKIFSDISRDFLGQSYGTTPASFELRPTVKCLAARSANGWFFFIGP